MMMHCCVDIDVSLCTCISGGEKPKFGPNTSEFVRRFDAGTTEGQGTYIYFGLVLQCNQLLVGYRAGCNLLIG